MLKLGLVTAFPQFIAKLQSFRSQNVPNVPTRALQEYGRLPVRGAVSEAHRRTDEQGRGPARATWIATQPGELPQVVTNAVVLWNTVYMSAVLDQLRSEGYNVDDGDVMHPWPARYAHINPLWEIPL
jgi:hypothetical protein